MSTTLSTNNPGVFISHRGQDAALAERLATDLKQAGYQVWLDEWEIGIGDLITREMNAGLQDARYVIVCYSSAGVLSPWMSQEWLTALSRQLEGHDVKLLPALLSGGEPPAILAGVKYADLVADWNKGVADLIRAMR